MSKIKAEDFSIAKANKKDFKKSTIERSNLTNTFTLEEMEADVRRLETLEREMTAQIKVSKAAIDNINRNHTHISKMSDEALRTAAYVYETKQVLTAAEKKLKEVKDTKKKYAEVKDVVYAKFNFSDETDNKN